MNSPLSPTSFERSAMTRSPFRMSQGVLMAFGTGNDDLIRFSENRDKQVVGTVVTGNRRSTFKIDRRKVKRVEAKGYGGNDTIQNFSSRVGFFYGGAGNDQFKGGYRAEKFWGQGGNDVVHAGGGNDTVWGGANNDLIHGEGGNDSLLGEDGNDRLIGYGGNDRQFGGAGDDLIWGQNGDDRLFGNGGEDRIWGGNGSDALYGHAGKDSLYAGGLDEIVVGGAGDDTTPGYSIPASLAEYNIVAQGTTYIGDTSFYTSQTKFSRIADFSNNGELGLSPTVPAAAPNVNLNSSRNIKDVWFKVGQPLLGQAGATQFASNSNLWPKFGGNGGAGLDFVDVAVDRAKDEVEFTVDFRRVSGLSILNIFNTRTSLFANAYRIDRGIIRLKFGDNGNLVVGQFELIASGFIEPGVRKVKGLLAGRRA